MLHDLVEKLYAHQDLSFEETRLVFNDLFSGKIDPVVLGSILTFLKTKVGFFVCIILPLAAFFIYQLYKFIMLLLDYKKVKWFVNIK